MEKIYRDRIETQMEEQTVVRSIIAVIVGYLSIVFITMGMFVLLETLFKVDFSSRPIQVFILAFNFVTAVIGGYITALVARRSEMAHALGLGIFMFIMALFYLISSFGKEPLWFQIALVVSALPSALAGGYLRDWQRERTTKTQRTQRVSI